jgi:hypothetical protein
MALDGGCVLEICLTSINTSVEIITEICRLKLKCFHARSFPGSQALDDLTLPSKQTQFTNLTIRGPEDARNVVV